MRRKNLKFFEGKMNDAVHVIEIVIAVVIFIGIAVGLVDLVRYFMIILKTPPIEAYEIFHTFLGHCLLLLVGAELIDMIIHHSINSLLELILFVIARKMLIYSHSMSDLIYGTLAMAIIFMIIKFLIPPMESAFLGVNSERGGEEPGEGGSAAEEPGEDEAKDEQFAQPEEEWHSVVGEARQAHRAAEEKAAQISRD